MPIPPTAPYIKPGNKNSSKPLNIIVCGRAIKIRFTKNRRLLNIYNQLNPHMQAVRFRFGEQTPERLPKTNHEHENILNAFKKRDPLSVKEAIKHLMETNNELMAKIPGFIPEARLDLELSNEILPVPHLNIKTFSFDKDSERSVMEITILGKRDEMERGKKQ